MEQVINSIALLNEKEDNKRERTTEAVAAYFFYRRINHGHN